MLSFHAASMIASWVRTEYPPRAGARQIASNKPTMMRALLPPFPAEAVQDNCFNHPEVCDAVFIGPVSSPLSLGGAVRAPQVCSGSLIQDQGSSAPAGCLIPLVSCRRYRCLSIAEAGTFTSSRRVPG